MVQDCACRTLLRGYTVLGLAGAWPAWTIPGIKAVLALSPYCTPCVVKGSLGSLKTPVMYQGGTLDIGITPFVKGNNGAYDMTGSPVEFVEFDRAGHFAWTELNQEHQSNIARYSIAFLDKYVKGDATADPSAKIAGVSELRTK